MRRRWFALCLLLGLPSALLGQDGTCDIIPLRPQTVQQLGDALYIGGRTEFRCTDGVTVVSDSAMRAFGMRTLIGNVSFSDVEKTILTNLLQYDERTGKVVTFGNTTITDKKAGSILNAPNGLIYWRETEQNPVPRIEVLNGRPRLSLIEEAKPGELPAKSGELTDTTTIVADRMEIVGQRLFRGWGTVEIKRGELDASGNQTVFDDSLGLMDLWGIAHIKGDTYDVRGDSIHAEVEGDVFRDVWVYRNAKIDREDLKVDGHRMRVVFDSGAVQRLIAVGGARAGLKGAPQANANTPDFVFTADSIDARAPKQSLEQVIGVGNAYGSRKPDSLDLKLPELIQKDWLRGDTINAYFVEAPDSVKAKRASSIKATGEDPDSSFTRVLDRLLASGQEGRPATALYRMRSEKDSTKQAEVGYVAARQITALFRDGEVYDLNAVDTVRGVFLQPNQARPAAPGTTTQTTQTVGQQTRRRGGR
jgi:hypothetical protein